MEYEQLPAVMARFYIMYVFWFGVMTFFMRVGIGIILSIIKPRA